MVVFFLVSLVLIEYLYYNMESSECYELNKKHKIYTSGERAIILSVYKYFDSLCINHADGLPG